MALANNYIVEKSNVLNEVRRNNLSLQELRFFSIYLSKINSRDEKTRVVTFPLEDFRKIMELGRLNNSHIKTCFEHLLQQVVTVPNSDGTKGFSSFQIFKKCKLYQDELQQWQVEINANDEALPLMFGMKHYVKYELWNALRLKSTNQLRMYELLKQYETAGNRILPLPALKELLGLEPIQYPVWQNFKTRILDSCQQALLDNTDICFTYEPIKVGRKFTGVKFFISKNENYVDQLSLAEFINFQPEADVPTERKFSNEHISLLAEACDNEFDEEQMQLINSLMSDLKLDNRNETFLGESKFLYLQKKFLELNLRAKKTKITDRFAYLKGMIK